MWQTSTVTNHIQYDHELMVCIESMLLYRKLKTAGQLLKVVHVCNKGNIHCSAAVNIDHKEYTY